MIRIVHVISGLDTGGAEAMLAKLVQGMDRTQFSNAVISLTDRGQLAEQIESSGVVVHALGMRRGRPEMAALLRLIRLLKSLEPTIVQSWLYHADLLSTMATRFVAPRALVWNIRCSEVEMSHYGRLLRWVVALLSRLSGFPDGVIVNSRAGQLVHERLGYRPVAWHLIPNGFDLSRYCPDQQAQARLKRELGIPDKVILVGLVARFDPMKDHQTFLAAARIIHAAYSEVHFVLCGRGMDKANEWLADKIRDYGLSGVVHLLGQREDMVLITSGFDIACSSSIGEGFSSTIGEAMACGVPCVVTDVGDSGQIIGDTGRIVPAKNPEAFGKACLELIELGAVGRRMLGDRARARVEQHFDLRSVIRQYEDLYASFVKHRPTPA